MPQLHLLRRPDRQDQHMRRRCAYPTQFAVILTVTNRLQSLPSHPVARGQRGKRDDLLQCLKFFEAVSLSGPGGTPVRGGGAVWQGYLLKGFDVGLGAKVGSMYFVLAGESLSA